MEILSEWITPIMEPTLFEKISPTLVCVLILIFILTSSEKIRSIDGLLISVVMLVFTLANSTPLMKKEVGYTKHVKCQITDSSLLEEFCNTLCVTAEDAHQIEIRADYYNGR